MTEPTPEARPPVLPLAPPPGAFDDEQPLIALGQGPDADAPRAGGRASRIGVLAVGGLLLVGGTAFALTSAGAGGGATTPEGAAADLFEAIADEDAIGVLGALDPSERDAIREPMQAMVSELERLEVLDDSFDLGDVSGFDFEFEGLEFEVEPVRADLARVHLTAGEATISVDGEEIAVGDFVTDVLDEFGGDLGDLDESETSSIDESDDGGFLVARDTGDGWRISLGYTAAEMARSALGGAVPQPGDGIAAVGADSPTEAVEEMIRATAAFDFEGAIARMSSEMRPLREYAAMYSDALAEAEAEASAEVGIEVRNVRLTANERGSTALVTVQGFDAAIDVDGSSFEIAVDGDCMTLTGDLDDLDLDDTPFESGQVCADELDELSQDGFGALEDELAEEGIDLPEFGPFNPVEVGIVVVREDGKWFVSPVRTSLDLGVKGLQALNRDHLDAAVELVESLVSSFEDAFTSSFDEGFSTTEDPFLDDPFADDDFADDPFADDDFEDLPTPSTSVPSDDAAEPLPDGSFPDSFEDQLTLIFGSDASCVLAGVDGSDPAVAASIRDGLTGGDVLTIEAADALDRILGDCDVFGP